MSMDNQANSQATESTDNSAAKSPKIGLPTLPAPGDNSEITHMDISGGSASAMLDHLGPVVVGIDGTLSRITNFEKMTEIEKKNTVRIISKRNKERLDALKCREQGADQSK